MHGIVNLRFVLVAAACVLAAASASAQEGAIAGVVRDSSEAVLPGVRVEVTTGFTANITVVMMIGQRNETIIVTAPTPAVDVQNARQATVFSG